MTYTSIIETAREYAYSFFNDEEKAIILNCDLDYSSEYAVSLTNAWFRHYRKKLNELKGVK